MNALLSRWDSEFWVVVRPWLNEPLTYSAVWHTVSTSRNGAIARYVAYRRQVDGDSVRWPDLRKDGYRCVKVVAQLADDQKL